MKRLAGVGIILAMVGSLVLIPYLIFGSVVLWAAKVVVIAILAFGAWCGTMWLGGWVWDNVSKFLGWAIIILNMTAIPWVGLGLTVSWWAWPAVVGALIAYLVLIWLVVYVGGFAMKLIKGEK